MLNTKFKPWPSYSAEEIDAVQKVLACGRVNYWTGDQTKLFEKEFAEWCGVNHAIALSNGTVALELALRALGVGQGDEVIVTPRTFIASISCIAMVGATPVFADVDPVSGNLSAETIKAKVSDKTKAVICVHLAGWPCNMDPIMDIAIELGFYVIEDCAQAHGAIYKGRRVGSIGHIGAWSFCQDKIMSTGGEGGMVTTNDESYWRWMWSFKDHGKSYDAVYHRQHPPGFRWLHESFGTNFRMMEMQSAIGRCQLGHIDEWNKIRNRYALQIFNACKGFKCIYAPDFRCNASMCIGGCLEQSKCVHAQYKMYIYVKPEELLSGWSRDRIVQEINDQGVPCYQGSCSEVYLEKAFDGTNWRPNERLPNAQRMGETSLMFLVHPTLAQGEIDLTCKVLSEVLRMALK
jgi:dTDP-4-amino-4,6-dideoxygalactose transaminase